MDWVRSLDFSLFRDINLGFYTSYLNPFFEALSYSGLGVSLSMAYLLLLFFPRTRPLVLPLFCTLILSGLIIADGIFKILIPRDRPSNLYFAHAAEPHLISSFPSGHSCVSFGTAFTMLFLSWKTPDRKFGWILLVWACLVGLSRIYRGVHWPTDVLAGCLVGMFSASVVVLTYDRIKTRRQST